MVSGEGIEKNVEDTIQLLFRLSGGVTFLRAWGLGCVGFKF